MENKEFMLYQYELGQVQFESKDARFNAKEGTLILQKSSNTKPIEIDLNTINSISKRDITNPKRYYDIWSVEAMDNDLYSRYLVGEGIKESEKRALCHQGSED